MREAKTQRETNSPSDPPSPGPSRDALKKTHGEQSIVFLSPQTPRHSGPSDGTARARPGVCPRSGFPGRDLEGGAQRGLGGSWRSRGDLGDSSPALAGCLSVCLSVSPQPLPSPLCRLDVCVQRTLLLARPLPRPDPGSDIPARLGGDGAPGLPRPEIQEDLTAIKTSGCGRDSQAGQAGGRLPGTDTRVPGVPAERERTFDDVK